MSALCQKQTFAPISLAEQSVELIVQPDAHDVVGEMATEKPWEKDSVTRNRVGQRVISRTKVHVEIFDLPSHVGIRHRAFDPTANRPASLRSRRVKRVYVRLTPAERAPCSKRQRE